LKYVQVILPLKLDWTAFYRTELDHIRIGDKVKVKFAHKDYIGVVCSVKEELPEVLKDVKIESVTCIEEQLARISEDTIHFWTDIADYYLCGIGEVYKSFFPAMKIRQEEIHAKKKENLLKKRNKLSDSLEKAKTDKSRARYQEELKKIDNQINAMQGTHPAPIDCIQLNESQSKALEEIRKGFADKKIVLLEGVTGSGKTEIYAKQAIRTLQQGKNVLYLVPEIALSLQLEERLRSYLGDSLMVFHSKETASRRAKVAREVSEGKGNYVVLGTRSALFLPHHNLGLVIVDEEHDGSYKQTMPAPRYNGRDAAIMLAWGKADILLGSATPSYESLYNAKSGKYCHVRLSDKYYGGEESEVEVIDSAAEYRKNGMVGSFSRKLMARIDHALERKDQVMILRSRRSYSPAVQCTACGDIPKCPHCNISLSHHKDNCRLICHHCGYSIPYYGKCAKCGAEMTGLGSGTQKIEEELAKLFPQARVGRLDSDVDEKEGDELIHSFANGETDILVGTQMISKGFDFDRLSLVAVIQADSLLGVQDFRADEKAFQTLQQLRGRCSRRGERGLLVIQTRQAGHPVYRKLLNSASGMTQDDALAERQLFSYPPFTRLVNVDLRDENEKRLALLASRLHKSLSESGFNASDPFGKPSGKCIQITFRRDASLVKNKSRLKTLLSEFEKEYKYIGHISIDVDPQ